MRILALDVFENKLAELVKCLRSIFPDDEIVSFTDPFFAAQYGFLHKVDMVFTEICMNCMGGVAVATMKRERNKRS